MMTLVSEALVWARYERQIAHSDLFNLPIPERLRRARKIQVGVTFLAFFGEIVILVIKDQTLAFLMVILLPAFTASLYRWRSNLHDAYIVSTDDKVIRTFYTEADNDMEAEKLVRINYPFPEGSTVACKPVGSDGMAKQEIDMTGLNKQRPL
ncbi:unnamed protein product [Sphagnum tenellum]